MVRSETSAKMSEATNVQRRMSEGVKVNSNDEQFKSSIEIEDCRRSSRHQEQHHEPPRHNRVEDENGGEKKKHQITFAEALIHLFKAGIGPGKY